jgi:hypothetical protein
MVSLLAATRVASRWLQMDVEKAAARAQHLPEIDAVYVCDEYGWGVLVGNDLRPLLADPGLPLAALIADFAAGWRTDYSERGAA